MTRRASRTLTRVLTVTTVVGLGAYAFTHRNHTVAVESAAASKPKPVTMLAATDETPPAKSLADKTPDTKAPAAPTTKPADRSDAKFDVKPLVKSEAPPVKLASATIAGEPQRVLSDAKAKIDAGELLAARKLLNDPLVEGQFTGADAIAAKQLIAEANKMIVFSTRRFNEDPWAATHSVAAGEVLAKIAFKYGCTPDFLLQINGLSDARKLRAGSNIKVIHGPFHVVVTKHAFTLDLYLGSPGEKGAQFVAGYPVGLGKDDSTPTGTWIIDQRIANPKWWGARGLPPIEAGDPKNPLGKYWISLTGIDGKAEGQQSYGIHGTIEPESIGKQSSMGCIRMRNEDVAVVYALLVSGKSTVVVRD